MLLKIVLIGDMNVGKTSLVAKYCGLQAKSQTIGIEFQQKKLDIGSIQVNMQIWDTAGQEKFQSLGFGYYRGTNGAILVFDLTDRKSFDSLAMWRKQLIDNANPLDPTNFPVVVLGNKSDLQDRKVSTEEAKAWCFENGKSQYLETDAIKGIFVDQAFFKIAEICCERLNNVEESTLPTSLGAAGGAMQLSAEDDIRRTMTLKQKQKEGCC